MGAVDDRVRHDDDTVIATIVYVEFDPPYAAAERSDQRAYFRRLKHLVETGFFDVENFAL